VVDDDRDVRRSLSFMLGSADFQSRPFASGHDLIDSLDELQPDACCSTSGCPIWTASK
jgi:FixJ family two-component response regulator